MCKYRIRLDTYSQIRDFVSIAEKLPYDVHIENRRGTKRGNAKTLLNVISAMDYDKIYILSNHNIYTPFRDFIINET